MDLRFLVYLVLRIEVDLRCLVPGGGEEVPKVDLRGLTGHHGHQCLLLGQEVHGGRLRQLTQVPSNWYFGGVKNEQF